MDYIEPTKEFIRIKNLPRRTFDPEDSDLLATRDMLTAWLKTPYGTQELTPIQAFVLRELHDYRGFIGAIPVGRGKTHMLALAPSVVECKRPVLIVPAKHQKEKTPRHLSQIAQHWQVRDDIELLSYEKIGVVSGKDILFDLQPDLLLMDEIQYVKNRKGVARTKRIEKYIKVHKPRILGLSGTFMDRSLRQGWHILYWALPLTLPLPRRWWEFNRWCQAVEEDPYITGIQPGVLQEFCGLTEGLADGVGRRIVETPGIVAMDADDARVSLSIEAVWPNVPDEIQDSVAEMRETWETPGGEPFELQIDLWRHARTLGVGYFNRWKDPPPKQWLDCRREWSSMCRDILRYSRTMETPKEVALAATRGKLTPGHTKIYQDWADIRDIYRPVTVPVWISDYMIRYCKKWLEDNDRGLVWCELKAFSERLAKEANVPYFCHLGKDRFGTFVEDHKGPCVVSPIAVRDGYNLQYNWSNNLIVSCPPNNETIEQVIGRTHREFQTSDEVTVKFVFTVDETVRGFQKMLDEARMYRTILNSKLLYADYINLNIDEPIRRSEQ
jgi:hypothetical protein